MTRPPGRPPLDVNDPSVRLTLTLPSKQLDQLCVQAKQQRQTIHEYLRALIKRGELKTLK